MKVNTPILFLIFKRPDTTARVFNRIRKVCPTRLYIAADGARPDRPEEQALVQRAREVVLKIDWPCEVKTLFRTENLGCGKAVSQAIDWFFEFEEEGIILEDDCLPALSFFSFCEKLLYRYRNNEKIMHIGGNNFIHPEMKVSESYYFSKYNHIWGWATWRRAWKHYDFEMKSWLRFRDKGQIKRNCADPIERQYWTSIFEKIFCKEIDTWDYQWTYACWTKQALSVLPAVNLVSNIGFTKEAIHTTNIDSPLANLPVNEIFYINHPLKIIGNEKADRLNFKKVFLGKNKASLTAKLGKKIFNLTKKLIRKILFRK